VKKKHEALLEILADLDDRIIEIGTAGRIKLLRSMKTAHLQLKRILAFSSAAAAFLLVLTLMIFRLFMPDAPGSNQPGVIIPPEKQVPIYQGMTVSTENGMTPVANYGSASSIQLLSSKKITVLKKNDPPFPSEQEIYYVPQGEEFYITVHLHNPDDFEIMSFTLNGKKYTSYMFEPGSDMENIILKCTAGQQTGITEYTIDAIKYIDGTKIKDVIIGGDQTVSVYVYDKTPPTAALGERTVGYRDYKNTLTLSDPNAFLKGKKVTVKLFEGETLVSEQQLDAAEELPIHLTELKDLTEYRMEISATYDPLDGGGEITGLLASDSFTTASALTLSATALSPTKASYTIDLHVPPEDTVGYRVLLYQGSKQVKDVDLSSETISDLQSDCTYTLHVDYFVGKHLLRRSVEFKTPKMPVPSVSIGSVKSGKDWGSCRVNVTDEHGSITDLRVDLLQSGEIVHPHNGAGTVRFNDLNFPFEHVIRVTYTYDLRDGNKPITKTVTSVFHTQSEGLKIQGGKVVGIGSCTDTDLYINMPIGAQAFEGSTVRSLTVGARCTTIGRSAFYNCPLLESVYMYDGVYDGVTEIHSMAFYNCKNLKSVRFSNRLQKIETGVFSGCTAIESIELPDSLTYLGGSSFSVCDKLKSVTFGKNLTVIPEGTFFQCFALAEVKLPEALTRIENMAFTGCEALSSITLPGKLQYIGRMAFAGCPLKGSLIIPDSVTYIADNAFTATHLTEIYIPKGILSIGTQAFGASQNVGTLTVYCEDAQKPTGWNDAWIDNRVTVVWGYQKQ